MDTHTHTFTHRRTKFRMFKSLLNMILIMEKTIQTILKWIHGCIRTEDVGKKNHKSETVKNDGLPLNGG